MTVRLRDTIVAAIGDAFILPAIWENVVHRLLGPVVGELAIRLGEENWPEMPLMFNDEVKEFVGDPVRTAEFCQNAEVIVTHVAPITRAVIERANNLKIIGCCRGGPVNINVAAASERGIPVVYTPGRNTQAVVEFTLGLILAEAKGIGRAHCALARGEWRGDLYRYDKAGRELQGCTMGLVGFGAIARMLVPYLRPFGMRILAYDPYAEAEAFAELGVEACSLPRLLAEADIVSLHARVTQETVGMIGEEQFRQMKPGAYFINTARGPLVEYAALYRALAEGRLAGAGLDTFAVEPPEADWPLLKLDNVTLTPHIAGSSKETAYRSAEILVRDVVNFFSEKPLQHCANPQVLPVHA